MPRDLGRPLPGLMPEKSLAFSVKTHEPSFALVVQE